MELNINEKQQSVFRCIVDTYIGNTQVPEQGWWKGLSNSELWLRHVEQVMVVGGVVSKYRLDNRPDLQQAISFDALSEIADSTKLENTIHDVLLKAGTRYVGEDITLSAKTKALVHNFYFIKNYPGQFTGLLQDLALFAGDGAELARVAYLMQHLNFFKNKTARDYLMNMGLNRNTLALDIRIQNIFQHVGVQFPSGGLLSSAKVYDSVEQQIIKQLCVPLQLEPVVLDRILFQNYRRIMHYDYIQFKLLF